MTQILHSVIQDITRPRVLACWVSATAIATLAGPFGSFDVNPWVHQMVYWGLVIGVSIVLGNFIRNAMRRIWPALNGFAAEAAAMTIFALAYTPVLWWITAAWAGGAQNLSVTFPQLLGFVLVVAASVTVFVAAFRDGAAAVDPAFEAADEDADEMQAPLLLRLPTDHRGEIFAVCASDHYVHVFTDQGRTSLLMRFADAIAELGDVDGMQVHRSHWVARAAVTAQRRENGRLLLVLRNGVEVPVSRSYRAEVEDQFSFQSVPA